MIKLLTDKINENYTLPEIFDDIHYLKYFIN